MNRSYLFPLLLAGVLAVALGSTAFGQTPITVYTWTGNGNSNGWYDTLGPGCPDPNQCNPNLNWDIPPDPNGVLLFQGNIRTTNTNNRFNTAQQIKFNSASDFFLNGDPLRFPTQRPEPVQIQNDGTGTGSVNLSITFDEVTARPGEINAVGGDIIMNGTVSIINNSTGIALLGNNSRRVTFNGAISGAGKNLSLMGNNTVVLNASNTFSGATTVNAGTLNAAVAGALGGTTSITVNNGGTLLVTTAGNLDRINNNTPITLGSAAGAGTASFARSGSGEVSEGSGATRNGTVSGTSAIGLGALTLLANSNFDFGTLGVGTFTLTTFVPNGHVLDILNWTSSANFGSLKSGVDGTDDRLIFSQDQASNLAFITFNGTPAAQIPLDGSFVEIVPIPEAATWVVGLLIFGAMAVTQKRRLRAFIF